MPHFSDVQGKKDANYFYVKGEDVGDLKGIRIFLSLLNLIKGIQLRFGNDWSDVYGSRSLKYKEFLLKDGEHVTQVSGTRKLCLTSLSFTTDKGRALTFGVRTGRSFDESGGSDKHLVTVNGTHTPGLCITGMGFKWEVNTKDLKATEPPREPVGSSEASDKKEDEGKDNDDAEDEDNNKDGDDGDDGADDDGGDDYDGDDDDGDEKEE